MHRTSIALIAIALAGATAQAQDHGAMDHRQHMAAMANDSRQAVHFAPEMREHTLSNMRDHLQALSEILDAMATAQYGRAAKIANARLGMDSPSADGCKGDAPQMSKPASMDHQMAQVMPEAMRNAGAAMHESASAFAVAAQKAGKTGNPKPALAALARVGQQCSACHSSFRLE